MLSVIIQERDVYSFPKPLTLSVVGCGGEGPKPLASQHSWRAYEENDNPMKATDKIGGSLLTAP
jgi:hypothetical protein